jgi:GNAT superfamily N-acetyltransferase
MIEIAPIVPAHIDSFHHTLDTMARERRYLAMLEAPPLENPRSFVQDNISQGHARFTALSDGEVVGWCDATPKRLPIHRHIGVGVLPAHRGQGIGRRRCHNLILMAVLFPD